MTRGAWMCRQQGDGLQIWYVPRQSDKPCTDSERAQKWRLSLASLLFFTVLLSDHLWLCAEANLTGIRDQEQGTLAKMGGDRTDHLPFHVSLRPEQPREASSSSGKHTIFIGNITARPSWQLETCYPHCLTDQCFIVEDAESICGRVSERLSRGAWSPSFRNFHLAFCESYTLSELFAGMPTPEGSNCHLNVVMDGDASVCVQCVETYQRLDQHAQEKYEEFQVLFQKYLHSGEYSVKSCIQDCKYQPGQKTSIQGLTEFQVYFNHSLTPIKLFCHILKENQLSTKPGSVPSISRPHSFTVVPEFLASNTVWRSRPDVHLFYQTMRILSMVDCQVSFVQSCPTVTQPLLSKSVVMSGGSCIVQFQINNPKGQEKQPIHRCVTGPHLPHLWRQDCVIVDSSYVSWYSSCCIL
ncbi:transmembrane protein FAM155A-like isoform X1 [Chiloscyllium plagiosum]|uniref:transmembrane protein FAM155A-like isoform X1 n=1 Tax=Chiloscyllium plagiosum TaxID=36176 RepID=UPI001CB885DF|nr:transmembrane protein FAM155A-like isoform X1 [Chiloscyllium plagiosum]